MESTITSLEKVDLSTVVSFRQGKKELEEGMQFITQLQKLIWLADCSEYRWKAVNEYEKDEDDDVKLLEKAKKVAEQKAFKK